MGCCQSSRVTAADEQEGGVQMGDTTQGEEDTGFRKVAFPRFDLDTDEENRITRIDGDPWCIGWEVIAIDGVRIIDKKHFETIKIQNQNKPAILLVKNTGLGGEAPALLKIQISKGKGDIGLILTNDLTILKAEGVAEQHGLKKYEGWRVVDVNGISVSVDPNLFRDASFQEGDIILTLEERSEKIGTRDLAWWKIKRVWRGYRERKQIDELFFSLILRDLEIQEEHDLNTTATLEIDEGNEANSSESESSEDEDEIPRLNNTRLVYHLKKLFKGERPSDVHEVQSIITYTRRHFRRKKNVHLIPIPSNGGVLTIVGDLHGQIEDLLIILNDLGTPSPTNQVIFNGDIVDRGEHSVEALLIIMILVLLHPDAVHVNRGNHEDERVNMKYGFDQECSVDKYNLDTFQNIQKLFKTLPLMHTAREVAIVHGGLPEYTDLKLSEINRQNRIKKVPRGSKLSKDGKIMQGLLWSDPRDDIHNVWEKSKRGAGVYFSKIITESFLSANKLRMLVRSHQTVNSGVKEHHNGLVRTVFSASKYCGKQTNKGAVMILEWEGNNAPPSIQTPSWDGENKEMFSSTISEECEPILTPKEEVMKRVRGLIFTRQVDLLRSFQEIDQREEGKITKTQWVTVMRHHIPCLPWTFLCRHVAVQETDGMIAYVPFLQRYQSIIAARWIAQWCDAIIPYVILRIGDCIDDIEAAFATLDTDGTQKLSYHEFFMFLTRREHLTVLDPESIYYILQVVDSNRDGFISLSEFKKTFQFKHEVIKDTPDDNHLILLWEGKAQDPEQYANFQAEFREMENGEKGISTDAFVKLGLNYFSGRRATWKRTALLLTNGEKNRKVRLKHIQKKLRDLEELRNRSKLIMEVIHKLSITKISLKRLFLTLSEGSGKISKTQFKKGLKKYMLDKYPQWGTLWSLLDLNSDGFITLSEFLTSLAVTDSWSDEVDCIATRTHIKSDDKMGPGGYFSSDSYDSAGEVESKKKKKKKKGKGKKKKKKRDKKDDEEA